jgi:hypothetical protein
LSRVATSDRGPAMTQFASRFADLAVVTLIFSALIGG